MTGENTNYPCSRHELAKDWERNSLKKMDPDTFYIRQPPPAHELKSFITPDERLFQTIHMGAAVVDMQSWRLVVDGLVDKPLVLTLSQLQNLPVQSLTSFHECYGSPLKPPDTNVWRIGNVIWTGVQLNTILQLARPKPEASYVWSEGLDRGKFGGYEADRYQKDLPLSKAIRPEVMLVWKINGDSLNKERGGPVRLIVPGWFGTNSTKWICRLSLQAHRAPSIFTTVFYNEIDPTKSDNRTMRPVWQVEPNSIIVEPRHKSFQKSGKVTVRGWAWSADPITQVDISINEGESWTQADLASREEFSWQEFELSVTLLSGKNNVLARATSQGGLSQPLSGRRNHCPNITIDVA